MSREKDQSSSSSLANRQVPKGAVAVPAASLQTVTTISSTGDEIDGFGGQNVASAYACKNDLQSLDNPDNTVFVPTFKKAWEEKAALGGTTPASCFGRWLWKLTAKNAGYFDNGMIETASPVIEFDGAPVGSVGIFPNLHHWSKAHVVLARVGGRYDPAYCTPVEPNLFPARYQ